MVGSACDLIWGTNPTFIRRGWGSWWTWNTSVNHYTAMFCPILLPQQLDSLQHNLKTRADIVTSETVTCMYVKTVTTLWLTSLHSVDVTSTYGLVVLHAHVTSMRLSENQSRLWWDGNHIRPARINWVCHRQFPFRRMSFFCDLFKTTNTNRNRSHFSTADSL